MLLMTMMKTIPLLLATCLLVILIMFAIILSSEDESTDDETSLKIHTVTFYSIYNEEKFISFLG